MYLPTWPTDRLARTLGARAPSPDTPLVLAGREGNRRIVHALNRIAQTAGLRAGMPVTKAQALIPDLTVMEAEPEADADGLEKLAVWALQRFAPIAAADPPDGIVIDATGAAHLHGGEEAMLTSLVDRLREAGVMAHAAMADTWGAAHALVRFGMPRHGSVSKSAVPVFAVPPGESMALIPRLPVAALRLPAGMVDALHRLGFESIGDLVGQPRAPLALRFGPELHRRLDQALGKFNETIEPARPPELIEVRRSFAEPISAPETLARYTGKLTAELCEILEAKTLGARKLDLLFHRVDNRIEAIRIGTATPVYDVKRLTRLLSDKIETIDPGFGIELMSLRVPVAEPFARRQLASFLSEEGTADISDLIDTLANRVGAENVYRFEPVESDVPERSVKRVPPLSPSSGKTWQHKWPRPARLLPSPEPIETIAVLPDHPPVQFVWKGVRRKIKRADGPERVFGEWWVHVGEAPSVRDYFQVEDETGERFWIYRAGDGENPETGPQSWFLHGFFG
jgi:protein ImuB